MTSIDEMEEYVNWDKAGDAVGNTFQDDPALAGLTTGIDPNQDNIDLVLANVDEDDFGFCALQHFSNSFPPGNAAAPMDMDMDMDMDMTMPIPNPAPIDFWDTPDFPCANCTLGGFSCKTIREGQCKGCCTSCVALRVECSFGGPETTAFLINPWPATGPHPKTTVPENVTDESFQLPKSASVTSLNSLANNESNRSADQSADESFAKPGPPPKIGARFSRESVRILKQWLSTHNRHPYPSDEEKEMLQRQTGLNKTQITNWLANARRRGKVQAPRSTSPHYGNWSGPIDIPQRRGTPALEAMNPLQRWEHSPPENEPASVTAIARAVTASSTSGLSSGLSSPFSFNYNDDGSNRSLCNQSSASSLGTSHSSGGSLSAYSHGSRNSWGSFGSAPFNSRGQRRRRRRRAAPKQANDGKTSLSAPPKTFQCTFCTETFRTKHDWQRHEKSLHLSLERWVCAPDGPQAVNQENGQLCCVFCGIANPDEAHIESHNHSACQERSLEERTFYRKDHLNQHLRLVHNVKFVDWSMKAWKVATPEIRSRCGFCGIVMDTWTIRVDHLAEHFKTGYSMADWKGDWGFEVPVLDMVENSIPPYLIHHERTSPLPYVPSQSPPETPRNAYELIKLEMAYFSTNHQEQHGRLPTDEEMMVEGCRIIFASELLSLRGIATQPSWLRDIIMSSKTKAEKARFGPLRGAAENRLATLKINGKDNLFEECPMEFQLHEFVKAKRLLGLTAMDDELQEEACRIVGRVEEVSTHPSDAVANWLLRLVVSSTNWLAPFRRRAHLPRSEDVKDQIFRSTDPTLIDSTIHNYSRLERELGDYLKLQREMGLEPTDEDLQRQARIIIYEFDDGWNQTAADNVAWLNAFKGRHPISEVATTSESSPAFSMRRSTLSTISGLAFTKSTTKSPNCYRRLAKELGRYVASTMSANNPNQHVPTDAELQHQARWILYDDDDPWNQTAADNAEWLQRFKRDVGIIKEAGPGLPEGNAWAVEQGGTGFAPPYAYPKAPIAPFNDDIQIHLRDGSKPFPAGQSVANSYVENLRDRYPRPAAVFCSRELEHGLVGFVENQVSSTGRMPTDEAIQQQARQILNTATTAAEDPVLLGKFKDYMKNKLPTAASPASADALTALPADMDLNISDEDLNNILQDMNFEFDTQDFSGAQIEQMEDAGGVSLNFGSFKN
ncbi:Fc.00g087520.m01.CDS01 [Cosmosporella sp. VM-42]